MRLTVNDLHTSYGSSHVLQGVSLAVESGEVVVLLGRNGAGKTTLLRSLVGLTRSQAGRVCANDEDLERRRVHAAARLGVVYVPSGRRAFGRLTVSQNLALAARSCPGRKGPWSPERVFDTFPKLRELASRQAGFLSGGEQQMLKLGRALVVNPEILLLDEPTEGLSPAIVNDLGTSLEILRQERFGVLLAEQNAVFALGHASRGYILEKGRISFEGTTEEIWAGDELHSSLGVAVRGSRVGSSAAVSFSGTSQATSSSPELSS